MYAYVFRVHTAGGSESASLVFTEAAGGVGFTGGVGFPEASSAVCGSCFGVPTITDRMVTNSFSNFFSDFLSLV